MSYNPKKLYRAGRGKDCYRRNCVDGTLSVGDSATVPVITTAATAAVLGGEKPQTKGAGDTVNARLTAQAKNYMNLIRYCQ